LAQVSFLPFFLAPSCAVSKIGVAREAPKRASSQKASQPADQQTSKAATPNWKNRSCRRSATPSAELFAGHEEVAKTKEKKAEKNLHTCDWHGQLHQPLHCWEERLRLIQKVTLKISTPFSNLLHLSFKLFCSSLFIKIRNLQCRI
jgi:hypothetical protein